MWIASLPLWFVSFVMLLVAIFSAYQAYRLALSSGSSSEEIGTKAWLSMAFLVLCSLLAALASLVGRL